MAVQVLIGIASAILLVLSILYSIRKLLIARQSKFSIKLNVKGNSSTPYKHYSLLASIESELGLGRLGYAADAPAVFGPDVFRR
jgi:hypothetical protein